VAYLIRWMIRRDVKECVAIERCSFPVPWSEDEFIRTLRRRNCIGMVAEVDDLVVGYMVYDLQAGSIEVINLAVHPAYRLAGVGTAMLDKVKSKLTFQRRRRVVCRVCEDNLPAHLWLRKNGFRAIGVDRAFYDQSSGCPDGDAYRFEFAVVPATRAIHPEVRS